MEITSLGNEAGYQQNVLSYTENNFCCDELENKSLNGGPVPSRLLLGSFLLEKKWYREKTKSWWNYGYKAVLSSKCTNNIKWSWETAFHMQTQHVPTIISQKSRHNWEITADWETNMPNDAYTAALINLASERLYQKRQNMKTEASYKLPFVSTIMC